MSNLATLLRTWKNNHEKNCDINSTWSTMERTFQSEHQNNFNPILIENIVFYETEMWVITKTIRD